jgi:hypothetical protein
MAVYLRFLLLVLISQYSPSSISAVADAKGWVEEDCSDATFHITKNITTSPGQQLVLRLNTGNIPLGAFLQGSQRDASLVVQAKECPRVGSCEEATQAKIWLNAMTGSMKRISGRYAVDFGDRHLRSQFVVKYRKHKPVPICE